MSYYLYDISGYIGEGPSVGGMDDFANWAESSKYKAMQEFIETGQTDKIKELIEDLETSRATGTVEQTRVEILKIAKKARGVLILSDGSSDNEPSSIKTLGKSETPLHAVADRHQKEFGVIVRYAFNKAIKAVDRSTLRATEEDAIKVFEPGLRVMQATLLEMLPSVLVKIHNAGAKIGMKKIKHLIKAAEMRTAIELPFDEEPAIDWAKKHAGELAVGLSETSRKEIAEAVVEAFQNENKMEAWQDLIEDISVIVGDDDRAERIAMNEVMTAANEGQRNAWKRAVDAGVVPPNLQRVVITLEDSCPICDEKEGDRAPLDGPYPDGGDGPPFHVSCRCFENIEEA
jgi:phage baseplate assembly protein W